STSLILVSIGPGYTPNTCVFCPRSIARVTWVSECVAAFEALYAARIGKLTNEATELRLTMAPPPFFREYWREGLRDREGAEEVHFHPTTGRPLLLCKAELPHVGRVVPEQVLFVHRA